MMTRPVAHWLMLLGVLVLPGLAPGRAAAQVDDDVAASANDPATLNDWSSIDLFWQVHDILAADDEPSTALWDSLFASTGYAALEARERRSGLLRQAPSNHRCATRLQRRARAHRGSISICRSSHRLRNGAPMSSGCESVQRSTRSSTRPASSPARGSPQA
jgi:hypothetical protein